MDPIIIKDQLKKLKAIISKPLTLISLLSLIFSLYVILRTFGIDIYYLQYYTK